MASIAASGGDSNTFRDLITITEHFDMHLFIKHFNIKTEEGSVGIRDCDNIQVIVTEQMYIDTFVCTPSHIILVPTTPTLTGVYLDVI